MIGLTTQLKTHFEIENFHNQSATPLYVVAQVLFLSELTCMLIIRLVGMISDLEITEDGDSNSIKESESLKVLRAVRVLRPLKIVSGIPSE